MIEYLIGVDGGELAQGHSGPSGLSHGIGAAWDAVEQAVAMAFSAAALARPARAAMAIGLGLAGVHNKQWAGDFIAAQPGYAAVALETDALTTLLGAHRGRPGAIVAIGTGSVGEVLDRAGGRREVGGWGFPSGDEAGGAWIGMRAVGHIQQVLDGRAAANPFAQAVIAACGGERDAIQRWLAGANQTAYAQLARLVLEHGRGNPVANAILTEAGYQVALIAQALDPGADLPVALCGGLAEPLRAYLPDTLLRRVVAPHGDSAAGALRLIDSHLRERA